MTLKANDIFKSYAGNYILSFTIKLHPDANASSLSPWGEGLRERGRTLIEEVQVMHKKTRQKAGLQSISVI